MLDARGERVLYGAVVVERGTAVVVALIDRIPGDHRGRRQWRLLPRRAGNSIVGQVVLPQHLRGREDPCGRAEAEADGRREGLRLVLDLVSPWDAAVLPESVESHGRFLDPAVVPERERLIDVNRAASLVGGSDGDGGRMRRRQVRRLRQHVHVTGRRTPADVRAGRPHEHFNLFEVVYVPRHQSIVAHVVDKEAVRGIEAAHVEHVAGRAGGSAAFAGLQGDAGNIAQRLAERRDALGFDGRTRNDLDRLRDVAKRRGVLGGRDDGPGRDAGDVDGFGADAELERRRRRAGPADIDTGADEQLFERLLNRERSRYSRRINRANGVDGNRELNAGRALERGQHGFKRSRRNGERARRGRLRALVLRVESGQAVGSDEIALLRQHRRCPERQRG